MHSKIDWDDLRYVLAVYRSGSVTKAARELNVNHATVIRRVAAFEDATGLQLFEKTVRGYQLISGFASILDAIRDVENSIDGVTRVIAQVQSPATGRVRVTSTDTFCVAVLPQVIAEVQKVERGINIDVITANSHLDLARLDADITVRPTSSLPDDLIGENPAVLGMGLYRHRDYAGDDWLAPSGPLEGTDVSRWTHTNIRPDRIVATSDSFVSLHAMACAGLGHVFLPDCLVQPDGVLTRLPGSERYEVPIWVAAHRDMIDVPRIRVALTLIAEAMARRADQLSGAAMG